MNAREPQPVRREQPQSLATNRPWLTVAGCLGGGTLAIGLAFFLIIAAVVIGGASLNGGIGGIGGSLMGALLMAVLRNATNQLGWDSYIQEIIIGAVIVMAVGLDKWRQGRTH